MKSRDQISLIAVLGLSIVSSVLNAQTNIFPTSGNAGIGTTTPLNKLDVRLPDDNPGNAISFGSKDYYMGKLGEDASTNAVWLGNSYPALSGNSYVDFRLSNATTGHTDLTNVNTLVMRILNSGYVGVGTTCPGNKLVVQTNETSPVNSKVAEFTNGGNNTYGSVYVSVSRYPGAADATDIEHNSGGSGPFRYGTYCDANIVNDANANTGPYGNVNFVTNGAVRMTVGGGTNAGNVGIGTTNPTYPLSVNGTVEAKEVIVQTGWSDYVFSPSYRLAPLSEVEQQIKTQKHLAGMPSAQEVAQHGVSLGDMQAKLLAKLEELTLHQIEQEKQLLRQQQRIGLQDERIQRLEEENQQLRKTDRS